MPDFVILDVENGTAIAAEYKPPNQSKREYLTGLGQTLAYTRDFHYALLVVPDVSDDDYHIAAHIADVLSQAIASPLPVGLLQYDPRTISSDDPGFEILKPLEVRTGALSHRVAVDQSFWAKWRDMSPNELGLFLSYLYDEGRTGSSGGRGTIRDRAFNRLWQQMVAGQTRHWGGAHRSGLSAATKVAWGKNFRNFVNHIGWCLPDGKLTDSGLQALRIVHQYGHDSRLFLDHLAHAVLVGGKHLVLMNAINEYQDKYLSQTGSFSSEQDWLQELETHLDTSGLLKRNPGRHDAAVEHVPRGFLKAEKTLWRNLGFVVGAGPHKARVFHRGRGFVFDWSRITSLLT